MVFLLMLCEQDACNKYPVRYTLSLKGTGLKVLLHEVIFSCDLQICNSDESIGDKLQITCT